MPQVNEYRTERWVRLIHAGEWTLVPGSLGPFLERLKLVPKGHVDENEDGTNFSLYGYLPTETGEMNL